MYINISNLMSDCLANGLPFEDAIRNLLSWAEKNDRLDSIWPPLQIVYESRTDEAKSALRPLLFDSATWRVVCKDRHTLAVLWRYAADRYWSGETAPIAYFYFIRRASMLGDAIEREQAQC